MSPVRTIAVAGASLAGLNAIEGLRDSGFEGRIVAVGAEDHLPYDRPPLSKEVLAGAADPASTALRDPDHLDSLDIDWELGRSAVGLDVDERSLRLDDGRSVGFDGLVIATGASPRKLPTSRSEGRSGPGQPEMDGLFLLRTLEDSITLGAELAKQPRVVVVGAGFIGSEVAATARSRGCEVTVLEVAPVPLAHALGEEMGRAVSALHGDHGVEVRCGVGVEGFEGAGRVERVRLADGSAVEADVVVVGVGVAPQTDWLDGSGLTVAPLSEGGGVVCDEACVAAPGVVAAGDVARWRNPLFGEVTRVEHWDNAIQQGRHAAGNLVRWLAGGEPEPFAPVPWFWSDQYDAKIQYAGRAAPTDEVTVIDGSVDARKFAAVYGREGRVVGVLAIDRPRPVALLRRRIAEGVTVDEAVKEFGR
ncbi:MAG: FAD-dependent oxidoreductase [Actinobacteria bacterium]|nr:FAD-dependent oxidoreductase [Actinomycetota bacterium]